MAKIDHESIQRWVTVRRFRRRFALRLATVAPFAYGRQSSAPGVGVPCPALASVPDVMIIIPAMTSVAESFQKSEALIPVWPRVVVLA
ncbi:MAG: hypothetical protein QOG75_1285 [Mycobacterium sp.]|jgi:hypothetical protein|nr:hypothetical protein [Mycobacterium sp.]